MISGDSRSEQVIAAYRRHKLAISAARHIQRILQEFERERALDRRFAWYGAAIIAALLLCALLSRSGTGQVVLF